jgi:hypothetical protein
MTKFATIKVEEINAKEPVEQLVINGKKQLDAFEEALKGTTYLSEYKTLITYVEYLADGNTLPAKKFRHLKGVADGVTEYEFKSKHLRLYAIQEPGKKLILFMGLKAEQEEDIQNFRHLKVQYLKQKGEENEKKRAVKKP